jgi:hypothetical protein
MGFSGPGKNQPFPDSGLNTAALRYFQAAGRGDDSLAGPESQVEAACKRLGIWHATAGTP